MYIVIVSIKTIKTIYSKRKKMKMPLPNSGNPVERINGNKVADRTRTVCKHCKKTLLYNLSAKHKCDAKVLTRPPQHCAKMNYFY